jgi:transcriptional regulator with GAF, ATPase, and Fis domain
MTAKGETRARPLLFVRGGSIVLGANEVSLGPEPLVVGRAPSCDMVIDDPEVSALHCELRATPDGVVVRDLGSTNGTHVGNVAVREAILVGRCELVLGRTPLEFRPREKKSFVDNGNADRFGALVGATPGMRRLYQVVARVAPTELSVLVTGETGTGKELVALAIHAGSARRKGPFVVLDCGAIAAGIAESMLFGHVRGAFTGASEGRAGAFSEASGGTLFLDELGELPQELQPKLLRVLAEGTVQRVGANRPERVDVRVVAATRRDIRRDVNVERFRSDLFFRIAQVSLELPPLRERRNDIPLLVSSICERAGRLPAADRIIELFEGRFASYDWPGNVRELSNMTTVLLALGERQADDLFESVLRAPLAPSSPSSPSPPSAARVDLGFVEAKRAFEADYFRTLQSEMQGNISAVARHCGLARHQVREHLRKLGLMPARDSDEPE